MVLTFLSDHMPLSSIACHPSIQRTDKFTKCVSTAVIALSGILSTVSCITEGDRTGKVRKTEWKPLPVNGSNVAKGQWHGEILFSLSSPFLLCWVRYVLRGGCESRCKRRAISTHDFTSLFFFLPSEPKLVNAGLASAMLLHSRQVQTSACSCLRETQWRASKGLSLFLAPVCTVQWEGMISLVS